MAQETIRQSEVEVTEVTYIKKKKTGVCVSSVDVKWGEEVGEWEGWEAAARCLG